MDSDWQSVRWSNGSMYEGLVEQNKMNRHGVFFFSNADRYEGEFEDNKMQGYGVYVWGDGTLYRGEWQAGMMHGCGSKLWRGAKGEVEKLEGKFFADEYVGPIGSCSEEAAKKAATEADIAASLARTFVTDVGRQAHQSARAQRQGFMGQPSTSSSSHQVSQQQTHPHVRNGQNQGAGTGGFGPFKWPEWFPRFAGKHEDRSQSKDPTTSLGQLAQGSKVGGKQASLPWAPQAGNMDAGGVEERNRELTDHEKAMLGSALRKLAGLPKEDQAGGRP